MTVAIAYVLPFTVIDKTNVIFAIFLEYVSGVRYCSK